MGRHLQANPAAADLASGTPTSTSILTPDGWSELLTVTGGVSYIKTFYTAASSGGTVNVLNTVTINRGAITSWTQAASGGGELQFNDSANSLLTMML